MNPNTCPVNMSASITSGRTFSSVVAASAAGTEDILSSLFVALPYSSSSEARYSANSGSEICSPLFCRSDRSRPENV